MMDQNLQKILPEWIRREASQASQLQEIRLRRDKPVQLICAAGERWLKRCTSQEDLAYCVNVASRYSPWAAETSAQGYLTAPGGHRIGMCGSMVVRDGRQTGIRTVTSLCIRVAREIKDAAVGLPLEKGSIIIIGRPGSGKTTLLRSAVRLISQQQSGSICVVDQRQEIFPMVEGKPVFDTGPRTDVLSGCTRQAGMEMAIRTMSPHTVAVDEITAEADAAALLQAARCGVRLLATAHALDLQEFLSRPLYRTLKGIFEIAVLMQPDKSWRLERMMV